VHPLERGSWVNAELVRQDVLRALERLQRFRLSARAIQREHQLGPEALPEWMLHHQPLKFGDDLAMPPERKIGLDPFLERGERQLVQVACFALDEGGMGQVIERWPADETERLAQEVCSLLAPPDREVVSPACEEALESLEIEFAIGHAKRVARSAAHDPWVIVLALEGPAQT
jgi:hypothetical protein